MNEMKRADIILIILLLVFAGSLFIQSVYKTVEKGATVEIRRGSEEPLYISLDESATLDLSVGNDVNIVCIENGKVYMLEANCRDQLCVRRGAVSLEGESIVCLPHRISITILGENKGEIDALSQ